MRVWFLLALVCAGCENAAVGTASDAGSDGPISVPVVDAAPDATPMPVTIYETATILPGPFEPLQAQSTNGEQLLGARFTTLRRFTVTGLGAHVYTICFTCTGESEVTQFMAIVAVDQATGLPTTLDLMRDAIGHGVARIPYVTSTSTMDAAPPSTVFPASFELPAGTWAVVIGGGAFDTPLVDLQLSTAVESNGNPQFIHYTFETAQWWYEQNSAPDKRMFVLGY